MILTLLTELFIYFKNEQVVVLWDEEDNHSKHMFGESIARARSLLQIVTCKADEKKSIWNFGNFFY